MVVSFCQHNSFEVSLIFCHVCGTGLYCFWILNSRFSLLRWNALLHRCYSKCRRFVSRQLFGRRKACSAQPLWGSHWGAHSIDIHFRALVLVPEQRCQFTICVKSYRCKAYWTLTWSRSWYLEAAYLHTPLVISWPPADCTQLLCSCVWLRWQEHCS